MYFLAKCYISVIVEIYFVNIVILNAVETRVVGFMILRLLCIIIYFNLFENTW